MIITIKQFIDRYIYAEIFATFTAMLGAIIIFSITNNKIISVYAGTICEGIGYYTLIVIRDVLNSIKYEQNHKHKYKLINFLKDIRRIIIEFGFSELLDLFIVRPFCMYIFTSWLSNFGVGILVGKVVADILFYVPTTIAYKLQKKYLN